MGPVSGGFRPALRLCGHHAHLHDLAAATADPPGARASFAEGSLATGLGLNVTEANTSPLGPFLTGSNRLGRRTPSSPSWTVGRGAGAVVGEIDYHQYMLAKDRPLS